MKEIQIQSYFDREINQCKILSRNLMEDGREDEAIFAKIRGNVFEIFNTIFNVGIRSSSGFDERVYQFFLERLEQILQNWEHSRENAKNYHEAEKEFIESIKLETANQIKGEFQRIWEGQL